MQSSISRVLTYPKLAIEYNDTADHVNWGWAMEFLFGDKYLKGTDADLVIYMLDVTPGIRSHPYTKRIVASHTEHYHQFL